MSITVKATNEGREGKKTSSGYVVDKFVSFVALPATRALHTHVRVTNPANGKYVIAEVLDVGPWNEHDDAYVFEGARPQAEAGISVSGKGTNHAGIDLGFRVWKELDMDTTARLFKTTNVRWEFVS